MTIILTIDNLDSLPDGGPTRFQAKNRSFEIGREQHLDWTLPDPGRYISGRHCEVRYENGGYWLYDVSTNGVFLNGSSQRVKSPYQLQDGERIAIGHYIINVEVEAGVGARPAPREAPAAPPPPPPGSDIWSIDAPAPLPVDRREFMPAQAHRREADFSNQFLEFPDIHGQEPQPERTAPDVSAWTEPGAASSPNIGHPPPADSDPFAERPAAPPRHDVPSALPAQQEPPLPVDPAAMRPMPGPGARPMPNMRVQPAYTPQDVPPASQPAAASHGAFLAAFAAGAGISPDALRGRDAEELAQEIGEFVKISVDNLRQLLKARAAAKTMTKSASRTMISATDNNPLKFVPGTPEAIEVMFAHNRPGYLHAKRSLEDSFADLKRHDLATYTAMQKALAKLVDEFSPEGIEQKAGSAAFAMKKSRAWDLFVAKWEERNAGENGMLDTFLAYFAEAYDEANAQK